MQVPPGDGSASKHVRVERRVAIPSLEPAALPPRTETPAGLTKTRVLMAVTIGAQVGGNVFLSRGMHAMGSQISWSPLPYLADLLNPWVAGGVCVLALWMIANLSLLSRADLSFVLPVTATSYVLIAIVGDFALGERISAIRWAGILVITAGVVVVGRTPTRTVPDVEEPDSNESGA